MCGTLIREYHCSAQLFSLFLTKVIICFREKNLIKMSFCSREEYGNTFQNYYWFIILPKHLLPFPKVD